MGWFDLDECFAFYGAYHSNPINIFLHTLFVWPIFFTSLLLLYFTPPFCNFFIHRLLILNSGFLVTLIYSLFYVYLDNKAGSLAAFLCFCCWVGASFLATNLGYSLAWKVVLAAQIICWSGQFIGHGVFEKRAPAFMDNLTQAFLMAPFFVLLEALQTLFHYEPYPGFHAKVTAMIDAQIKEWEHNKHDKNY